MYIDVLPKTLDGAVNVGLDIWAPPTVHLETHNDGPGPDLDFDLCMDLELRGRKYVVTKMEINQIDGGPAVTGEQIRKIPVQSVVRLGIHGVAGMRQPDTDYVRMAALTIRQQRDLVAAGPADDDTLRWVARVYIMAELDGSPPAKTVTKAFDVPTGTAAYWIRRAKDRGFMDPPASGQ